MTLPSPSSIASQPVNALDFRRVCLYGSAGCVFAAGYIPLFLPKEWGQPCSSVTHAWKRGCVLGGHSSFDRRMLVVMGVAVALSGFCSGITASEGPESPTRGFKWFVKCTQHGFVSGMSTFPAIPQMAAYSTSTLPWYETVIALAILFSALVLVWSASRVIATNLRLSKLDLDWKLSTTAETGLILAFVVFSIVIFRTMAAHLELKDTPGGDENANLRLLALDEELIVNVASSVVGLSLSYFGSSWPLLLNVIACSVVIFIHFVANNILTSGFFIPFTWSLCGSFSSIFVPSTPGNLASESTVFKSLSHLALATTVALILRFPVQSVISDSTMQTLDEHSKHLEQ